MTEARPMEAFDSGDPRQVKRKRDRAATKDLTRRNDIRAILATPEGQRTLIWIIELTGLYHSSFSTNALQMAYQEGVRKLGLVLTDELAAADPEAWVALQLVVLTPKEAHDA